ncbi:MAG: hypothetical protein A2140_09595 [Candidatus Muproteobacteria bacterium RBG_16_62_13]|uniref:Uncharacterized protein n=1 Tax=Candidatus Muproteobacteria bacterium RBG_16_62_13 TaxID=1817756 RepID=A0A1F6T7E5_9PROT|nr:MAG: hypothetical protein A2140_09595 [Candidatus Muproteobacteria bacterium RBG_16_62_13]
MALRMKTRFRRGGKKTPAERASVVAFNFWKLAQEMYRRMHKEDFKFGSDEQVSAAMITETLAFLVQVADRLVYGQIPEDERQQFVTALGIKLAETMQMNLSDLHGPKDYQTPFIRTLNERFGDYAEFDFSGAQPGYGFLRYFAEQVSNAFAVTDSKWIIEQIIEIEAPEILQHAKKLVHEVMGVVITSGKS